MFSVNKQQGLKLVAFAASVLGSVSAFADAAAPDTSSITTAQAGVAVVGAAVFAVYVGVKGFKWIRAAL